ncbi:hypothetical protein AB1Y20_019515 [Prymnesium parvum]|uniref:Uncharacterized protein n=1 Tax=Prymnesium parvum TaxID=97485 RepID=A0AB34JUT3_PRYPA
MTRTNALEQPLAAAQHTSAAVTHAGAHALDALSGAARVDAGAPCVYCAACCTIHSVGLSWPGCLGCAAQGTWCYCLDARWVLCKPAGRGAAQCCVFANGHCAATREPAGVCCRQQAQQCCCEHRCSFPCDGETPCMLTVLGLQLFRETSCTTAPKLEAKCFQRIPFIQLHAPGLGGMVR